MTQYTVTLTVATARPSGYLRHVRVHASSAESACAIARHTYRAHRITCVRAEVDTVLL